MAKDEIGIEKVGRSGSDEQKNKLKTETSKSEPVPSNQVTVSTSKTDSKTNLAIHTKDSQRQNPAQQPNPQQHPQTGAQGGSQTMGVQVQAGSVSLGSIGKSALISLWLDDYNDLFSDFDPRPYSQRALSDDFLNEVKKVLRETPSGKVELELLVPENLRMPSQESTIKKRLRDYFKSRYNYYMEQAARIKKQGVMFVSFGVILMLITTLVLFNFAERNFWVILLSVIAEPAGWFLFWDGMELLVFDSKERKSDLEFNQRMSSCNIYFKSY